MSDDVFDRLDRWCREHRIMLWVGWGLLAGVVFVFLSVVVALATRLGEWILS